MIRPFLKSHFFKFGVVGTGGYLVDVAVLKAMIILGLSAYYGQIPAFFCAAIFTWIVNRFWTFHDRRGALHIGHEWLRYIGVTIGGFCVNYAAYSATIAMGVPYVALAVAAGSIAGLMFNFPMTKYLVFSSALTALKADRASSEDL